MNALYPSVMVLRDYLNSRRGYRFDPTSGNYQVLTFECEKEGWGAHPVGFAVERRIGLSLQKTFVALYATHGRLLLTMGGKTFDFSSEEIQVKRDSVFPCVKRFRVFQEGKSILSLKYAYTDFNEDGGYDVRDFFILVDEVAKDRKSRLRFMFVWERIAEGREVINAEFQAAVDRQVEEALSRSESSNAAASR